MSWILPTLGHHNNLWGFKLKEKDVLETKVYVDWFGNRRHLVYLIMTVTQSWPLQMCLLALNGSNVNSMYEMRDMSIPPQICIRGYSCLITLWLRLYYMTLFLTQL